KLWFYGAARKRDDVATNLGAFFADGSQSTTETDKLYAVGKLTGQLTSTQKLIGSYQFEDRQNLGGPARFVQPIQNYAFSTLHGHLGKGEWQWAKGNKYLSVNAGRWVSTGPPQPSTSNVPSWKDSNTAFLYQGLYNSGGLQALNRAGQSTD